MKPIFPPAEKQNFLPALKPAQSTVATSELNFRSFTPLLLCLLVTSFLLFSSPLAQAQQMLMGLTSNGGPEGKGTVFSIKTTGTNFSVLKGFADWGKTPLGNLVKGPNGDFYGMTSEGGTHGYGTIFKVSATGEVNILRQLNYTTDGAYPHGSLTLGNDGNFYGMASSGGTGNYGTIFKITPTGTFSVLKSFSYHTDGARPFGNLLLAKNGNFYGITFSGGSNGNGVIFKITPGGTYTILKHLNGATDGYNSFSSLVQGKDGYLYGTTSYGGTNYYGTIFKISTTGTFKVLRHFQAATDGSNCRGSLVQAADGNFYGMAASGGTNSNGTIFKITPGGTFSVIKHLTYTTQGAYPQGSLIQGKDNALYGTTYYGGANGTGTIFKITTAGAYTLLRSLDRIKDGGYPNGSLLQNSDGNFYGLTSDGGSKLYGTIFKITSTGTYTVLNGFNGASQGNTPHESLLVAKDNAYYGTTSSGGTYNHGTIFKICGGNVSVLKSFNKNIDGGIPISSLIQGTDGNFYGTTSEGGNYGVGTIFKITPSGTYTVLRHLNSPEGSYPFGSLVQGKDGNFYGTNRNGGTNHSGTIFKITPSGTYTVLRHLAGATDGSQPEGSLVQGNDGNFYGTTTTGGKYHYGTIFKITPTGTYTVLRELNSLEDGNMATGSLILGQDGEFYGMASSGGSSYYAGTIFKINATGTFKVIKRFTPTTDGSTPKGNLVQGSDGNFYGLTSSGGTNKQGTIFRITPAGAFTVLRHFNLATDGGFPLGSLIVQNPSPLIANAQSVTTTEDTPKALTLTGSGGSPLTYNIISGPKNGTLSGTGANRTYSPKANFSGSDSFTFTVSIGCQTSAPATVTLAVSSTNDAPVLAAIGNKTVAKGSLLSFTATATDPDAGQTKTFSLVGAPAGATINATSGAFSWTPATAGTYTFTVKVTDNGSPALSDSEQITVTVTSGTTTSSTVRINGGGPAATTSLGSFSADAYFTGATGTYTTAAAIEGTTNDVIYQTYRRVNTAGTSFGYSIPVTNGTYTVKLHFAEIFHTAAGKRKFNVTAEGAAWLSNYDIWATAGAINKAVVVTKTITVADGTLSLTFTSLVDRACVSAIEVVPATTAARLASSAYPETEQTFTAKLYPNPAADKLTLTLNSPVDQPTIMITNAMGSVVNTKQHQATGLSKLEIAVNELQPGAYLLHVKTQQGTQTLKFIKR